MLSPTASAKESIVSRLGVKEILFFAGRYSCAKFYGSFRLTLSRNIIARTFNDKKLGVLDVLQIDRFSVYDPCALGKGKVLKNNFDGIKIIFRRKIEDSIIFIVKLPVFLRSVFIP